MAAKRQSTKQKPPAHNEEVRRGKTGKTGPEGPPGPAGPQGPPGLNHAMDIARLTAQVDQLVKELQTQLTRIAQIQAQLDHIATGHTSGPRNRRSTDRAEH